MRTGVLFCAQRDPVSRVGMRGTHTGMALFRIRGTLAVVAIVIAFAVAYALGAPGWAAIVIGIVAGPTIVSVLFAYGPLARAADRADHWLETPK